MHNFVLPVLSRLTPVAFAVAACATGAGALAQTEPAARVFITGNPLGAPDIAAPISTLSGQGLLMRRASTLGETLDGLPGVSATYFGPQASRPVIRGQDGERVRMLNNSGASNDASGLSADHAVALDPLVIERIEVLRGPAALLYGGNAIGGVVNAIDNRIPRAPQRQLSGSVELRAGGAAQERAGAALLETGSGDWALHVDAFARQSGDLRVPEFSRATAGGVERRQRVDNSSGRAEGGAVGASRTWATGYVGAAIDSYRNEYGVVSEDDVRIRMRRDKLAVAGEWRDLGGAWRTLRARVQLSDYQHEEVEQGSVGTTFKNRGGDMRWELEHRPLKFGASELRGQFGVQAEQSRFSALGTEAFVPSTQSRQLAGFVYEELSAGPATLSLGLRVEGVRHASAGDPQGDAPRFGPAQSRRFDLRSAALGGVFRLSPQWQLSGHLTSAQRAPSTTELFANGVHLATASVEQGNAQLGVERGVNLDAALRWQRAGARIKAGWFVGRYANYLSLHPTGAMDAGARPAQPLPVYAYVGVPARLNGFELEGQWQLRGERWTLDGKIDSVRGVDRVRGEPLPRLSPLRFALGTQVAHGNWSVRADLVRVATQDRVPSNDVTTPGYTLLNLSATTRLGAALTSPLVFVKVGNVGNTLAFNATSLATVRSLVPLPGRSLSVGLRSDF